MKEGNQANLHGRITIPGAPYDYKFDPESTALIVIDMQRDFCEKGGYVSQMGYDIELTRKPIPVIRSVLDAFRSRGIKVIHTREGHRPDLSNCPANKLWRSKKIGKGVGIGDYTGLGRLLVINEPGWQIISELAPLPEETIIDKPGKGSFVYTDLELVLRSSGISHLVLAGITTDVCVHTTMREANDRGFECLLLTDCTAATDPKNHLAAIQMIQMQGGVFGTCSDSHRLIESLSVL